MTASRSLSSEVLLSEDTGHTHLFRHASELARETKGGYIQGQLNFPSPECFPDHYMYLRLSLLPSALELEENPLQLHPNLIHVYIKEAKRSNLPYKESFDDVLDWFVLLRLSPDDQVVSKLCPKERDKSIKRFPRRSLVSSKASSDYKASDKSKGSRGNKASKSRKNGANNNEASKNTEKLVNKSGRSSDNEASNITNEAYKQRLEALKQKFKSQLASENDEDCRYPLSLEETLRLEANYDPRPVTHREIVEGSNGRMSSISLGNSGLKLNVITPLQKSSNNKEEEEKGRASITVIEAVSQRFKDLFQFDMDDRSLSQLQSLFATSKESRIRLQQVRLCLEVFVAPRDSSLANFVSSSSSAVLINSKSREHGPLQLLDLTPNFGCLSNTTKVIMLSPFRLADDVEAIFVIFDPKLNRILNDQHDSVRLDPIREQMKQPRTLYVLHSCLVLLAPSQTPILLDLLEKQGLELHLTAFRPSDRRLSWHHFKFDYLRHNLADAKALSDSNETQNCLLCKLQDSENTPEPPVARPGKASRTGPARLLEKRPNTFVH